MSVCLIKPIHERINARFLALQMAMPSIKHQADARIKGIGVPDLHLNQISEFSIICPPRELQDTFVDFVEHVDKSKLIVLHLFPFPAGLHQMTCIICPEIFIPNRRISLNHFFIRLYTSFSKRFVDNT